MYFHRDRHISDYRKGIKNVNRLLESKAADVTIERKVAMTPEERQLVTGLFDRLQNIEPVAKDRDADQLIRDAVRQVPDAPYLLVQSVLVQEQALRQADARIRELEERVANLPSGAIGPDQSTESRSFLGGAGGLQIRTTGSVPLAGRQVADPPAIDGPSPARDADRSPLPVPSGGGFLASALSTVAGVTGGMLLADSIRNVLGGGRLGDGASSSMAAVDRTQDDAQDAREDLAADDAALDDSQDAFDEVDGEGIDV
ncbi:DUF2076 domain-containing protein [Hyphomicrobium sp.]|uniref:DUF2076 domain-containing protein n=1 Tax=Hyphomicrobium sp. TaxID=82 RepID=UPI003F72E064